MFSRRLLRIKVFQILYAYYTVEGRTYAAAEKELLHSIRKTYELYHLLLLLLIDVADYAESRIDQARQKLIPSPEDLHPNTRFIENQVLKQLRNNAAFRKFLINKPLSWTNYPEIVRNLYLIIRDSEFYKQYMEFPEHSYRNEKGLLERICTELVMNYEDLYLNLEEQSIYWIDDVDFVIRMVVKTLRKFSADNPEGGDLLPMINDQDDLAFCKKLLRTTIKNGKEYLQMIKESANNWELERIAFTDSLILQLAISEALEFKSIPVKVTINEFIEIAKLYSTQKSSQFINGILDNILTGLKAEGKLVKTGRGLIGEV
jgi:N utilization substance protein B